MILKDKFSILVKTFYKAYWGYKKQIAALTVLGFLSSLLEGVGINAAVPLFSFLSGSKDQAADDMISKIIQKAFAFFHINFSLKYLFVFICFLFAFRVVVLILSNYIKIKISANYEERTRGELFKLTMEANWPHLLKQKLGHLETILITNVQYGSNLLQYISNSLMNLASLAVFLTVAINISWPITLITILLGCLIFFVFKPLLSKIRTLAREKEKTNRQTAHHINENILGLKTIRAMAVSGPIIDDAKAYFKRLKKLVVKTSFLSIITSALIQPIGLIYVFVIFAVSYKMQIFNFAGLMAVVYLIQRIFTYAQQLQSNFYAMAESTSYVNKMLEYREEAINNREADSGSDNFSFSNFLEFKDISFCYNKEKQILNGVNFFIARGEMIGLIGPSGAGKTTIVDLILRLLDPTSGKILLDGKNINNIKTGDWRKNIGYVSQDIFLKNDTIANNIRFYDKSITDEVMIMAAKMANIDDFIQSYPNKYETVIGERGLYISAGQRQRIVIARVLAKQPKILILDEATSSLDNESEKQIQQVIENLKNKVTVFLIAHRLSTVTNCTKLLVLQGGKIIEEGTPQNLLADKESYFYKVNNIIN